MIANRNRLGNVNNIYQGDFRRVLCVCTAGLIRSPTIASVLHVEYGYNTRAAGIDDSFALIVVDHVLLAWSQEIVVCTEREQHAIEGLLHYYHLERPIKTLGIDDNYDYMNDKLVAAIKSAYVP